MYVCMCICLDGATFLWKLFFNGAPKNSVTCLMKNMLDGTMCNLQFKNAMNIVFNFLTKQSWDTCFVPVLVIPRMLPSSKSGRTKNNKRFFFLVLFKYHAIHDQGCVNCLWAQFYRVHRRNEQKDNWRAIWKIRANKKWIE